MNAILITVRMNSSRLPNKGLFKLGEYNVLEYLIYSVKRCKTINKIIVCTSTERTDDVIEHCVNRLNLDNVHLFRGSIIDKLDRMYQASRLYNVKNIFYTGADNPLISVELIDEMMNQLIDRKLDFIDGEKLDIPIGSVVQAFTFDSIKKCCEIKKTDDTEMHTLYFKDSGLFKYGIFDTFKLNSKIKRPDIRMTMDYQEDYDLFCEIFKYKKNKFVDLEEIIEIIDQYNLKDINYFRNIDWNQKQILTQKLIL